MADIGASAGGNGEPSMEEILSSIKRIIADDTEATLSTPRAKRSVAPPAAEPEVLELTDAVAAPPEPQPEPAPPPPAAAAEPDPAAKPALVSPAAVDASRSSLAALSALVVKPEVTGGDTLEGLVREMLRPMLADWLDQRLPEVVERLVAQEIRRITDRG